MSAYDDRLEERPRAKHDPEAYPYLSREPWARHCLANQLDMDTGEPIEDEDEAEDHYLRANYERLQRHDANSRQSRGTPPSSNPSKISKNKLRAYRELAAAVYELDYEPCSADRADELRQIKAACLEVVIPPKPNPKRALIPQLCRGVTRGVYFILRPDGLCKIGRSRSMAARITGLQSQYGYQLHVWHIVPASEDSVAERWFHAYFVKDRKEGEWFDLSPSQLKWAKSVTTWPLRREWA